VTYLGRDDQHDVKYDPYHKTQNIYEAVAAYSAKRYSGVPLDTELCPMSMHIYPSDTYKNMCTSNDPIIFASVIIIIFAFVAFILFIYDQHVEKRQKFILNSATKSSAIVSSLFPSTVRDQMMERNDVSHKTNSNRHDVKSNGHEKNKHSSNHDIESEGSIGGGLSSSYDFHQQGALANLYPDTTVFFADLAGFTAWSR
jgi:hypothetical protein